MDIIYLYFAGFAFAGALFGYGLCLVVHADRNREELS
jgi:hypothetical protein